MIQFKVAIDDALLRRKVKRAIRELKDFQPEMREVGDWIAADARRRLAARQSRSSIGRLSKSLKARAYKLAVTVASVLPYARIQQEGGIVKPRRPRGYLAIPLRLQEQRNHAWPRHWKQGKLFLLKTKRGAFLAEERPGDTETRKGWSIALVYKLVKQVRIPGRPYLVRSRELVQFAHRLVAAKLDRMNR